MGIWDVDALSEQLPSRLLNEWRAFYRLEPRGELREDWRSALQTAFLFNVQVDKKHRLEIDEFLLRFSETISASEQSPDWKKMLATVEMLNAAFGGEDTRSKPGGDQ